MRTRDNLDLPLRTYAIRLFGVEVARGEAPPGTVLAIGDRLDGLPGRRTQEPVFGLAAVWVPSELRSQAELMGATVVDRSSVLTTHLAEVVRSYASRLLGREEVKMLTDAVRRTHPAVIDELTPAQLSLGEIQQVLQALLEESVSIRDLARIFEALSLRARMSKDLDGLVDGGPRHPRPGRASRRTSRTAPSRCSASSRASSSGCSRACGSARAAASSPSTSTPPRRCSTT